MESRLMSPEPEPGLEETSKPPNRWREGHGLGWTRDKYEDVFVNLSEQVKSLDTTGDSEWRHASMVIFHLHSRDGLYRWLAYRRSRGPASTSRRDVRKVKLKETIKQRERAQRRRCARLRAKMGIQGLKSLIERNPSIYREVQFSRSPLVVDGSNLTYLLYFSSGESRNQWRQRDFCASPLII